MSTKYWEFVARSPRHKMAEESAVRVELGRSASDLPTVPEATIVDFSRNGLQLRLTAPLVEQEAISVRLEDERSGMDLTLSGIVRWQRREDDDAWLVGCHCDEELDWETLGELFLNEVLVREEPSPEMEMSNGSLA